MSSTVSSSGAAEPRRGGEQRPAEPQGSTARSVAVGGIRLSGWTWGFLLSVLVVLIGSVLPFGPGAWNLWSTGGLFLLGVGVLVPLAAGALQVAGRPETGSADRVLRVGSLSVAQFGHVASWLAFAQFFLMFVTTLSAASLVGLAGALGMVVCSPLRFLFDGGAARRSASVTPAGAPGQSSPVPTTESPEQVQASWHSAAEGGWQPAGEHGWHSGADGRRETAPAPSQSPAPAPSPSPPAVTESAAGQPAQASGPARGPETAQVRQQPPRGVEPAQYDAFWFAVGTPRHTVHPDGSPAFGLEPGGWILALEDRGHEFLVQNTDGRAALLRDLEDIERA